MVGQAGILITSLRKQEGCFNLVVGYLSCSFSTKERSEHTSIHTDRVHALNLKQMVYNFTMKTDLI